MYTFRSLFGHYLDTILATNSGTDSGTNKTTLNVHIQKDCLLFRPDCVLSFIWSKNCNGN